MSLKSIALERLRRLTTVHEAAVGPDTSVDCKLHDETVQKGGESGVKMTPVDAPAGPVRERALADPMVRQFIEAFDAEVVEVEDLHQAPATRPPPPRRFSSAPSTSTSSGA
jgi:hypothetical protein